MSRQRANIRLFVDQDLEQGREIAVGDDRAHYLTRVMRLQPGDSLRLFNGRDGEWLARISAVDRSGCALLESLPGPPKGPQWVVIFLTASTYSVSVM